MVLNHQIPDEQFKVHLECQQNAVHTVWEHLLGQLQAETLQRREVVTSKGDTQ